jgi:acyl-[acyl-carrier-protein]-phospholipid O-acyltransferase/long-chain-fatty-acid--[acyl-carrier-protein] ligase
MNEHATNTAITQSGASSRGFAGESSTHANIAPRGLWNRGFISLLFTQFFEAASDNIIKGVLTFAVAVGAPWETVFGKGGNGLVGVAFTLPFILLSAFGGRIADRSSKSRITIILKTISLAVAALTAFEFARGSAWGALAALVAFAIVSAFFGPVKYGMIAELVAPSQLARANGIVNMATNVAVICGLLVAGVVAFEWKSGFVDGVPTGTSAWLPGIAMAIAVVLGFLTCLTLPKLKPQNPNLPVDLNPFSTYFSTLRFMAQGPLLAVAAAWTFFYFVAAVVLSILPDYSAFLRVTDQETSLLMAGLAVSIGIGCVVAAYLDTPTRRPLFVPLGAGLLALGFTALGVAPNEFLPTLLLLSATGLVAGFYIIPLQSMLQALAPDDARGRVLGTANGLSFVLGAVGSGLFFSLKQLEMPSNRIFAVLGVLCAVVALIAVRWLVRRAAVVAT